MGKRKSYLERKAEITKRLRAIRKRKTRIKNAVLYGEKIKNIRRRIREYKRKEKLLYRHAFSNPRLKKLDRRIRHLTKKREGIGRVGIYATVMVDGSLIGFKCLGCKEVVPTRPDMSSHLRHCKKRRR